MTGLSTGLRNGTVSATVTVKIEQGESSNGILVKADGTKSIATKTEKHCCKSKACKIACSILCNIGAFIVASGGCGVTMHFVFEAIKESSSVFSIAMSCLFGVCTTVVVFTLHCISPIKYNDCHKYCCSQRRENGRV